MADQMDIDTPSEEQLSNPKTSKQPQHQTQPQQKQPKKTSSSSSSTRELTTCTIKQPPFSYVHLSTVDCEPSSGGGSQGPTTEIIDPLQVRSYCTAALRQFLGETGASIIPDILLIQQRKHQDGGGRNRQSTAQDIDMVDIYLRLARQDLAPFAAAITAFPGVSWTTPTTTSTTSANGNGNGKGDRLLLLQVQSCGDWLGSLIGKSEEGDIWEL